MVAPEIDLGCAYCRDDQNRLYGHVTQIASDDRRRTLLLRCPRCGTLYENSPDGPDQTRRLTEAEAQRLFPTWRTVDAGQAAPSERLVDQRLRNRVIEALEVLADGDDGVRTVGTVDYVDYFFDIVDDRRPNWRELSTYTAAEIAELQSVHDLLVEACDATDKMISDDDFIASGWPERIKPVAAHALSLLLGRGRFSDEREEPSPSH